MEPNKIKRNLRRFIVDNFLLGDEQKTFSDKVSFLESGIMDSTGILELIEYVEEQYAINIGDDEVLPENLDSIQSLCMFIVSKSAAVIDSTA